VQAILLEEQKGSAAKENVPTKTPKEKYFIRLLCASMSLQKRRALKVYNKDHCLKIQENIEPEKSKTNGNFYYVTPLSLYLSTSAILTGKYYSIF
jgi:hypothetical protein